MGGCISTMRRRPKSSRSNPSSKSGYPQAHLPASEETHSYDSKPYSTIAENNDSPKEVCTVCYANPVNVELYCGHQICSECKPHIFHCPWCRIRVGTQDYKLIKGFGKVCTICYANSVNMVLYCGHQICRECKPNIYHCPWCRIPVGMEDYKLI